MSDQHAGAERQPTEEEVRAYLAQLRQTNVAEVVAQVFSIVASGAEVKLGRRDGRLLIDVAAAVVDATHGRVDERLTQQMEQALNQLRVSQVDAESQLNQLRDEGKLPAEEAGDLPGGGAAGETATGATKESPLQPGQQQPPAGSAGSRLWIPGR